MILQLDDHKKLKDFIKEGKHLQAWGHCQTLPPFSEWDPNDVDEQMLRERVRSRLGAFRSATAQVFWLCRKYPDSPKLAFQRLFNTHTLRGPWEALELMRRVPEIETDDIELRAEYFSLQGGIWAELHDFEEMARCYERADALGSGSPWIPTHKAWGLMLEDRFQEALEMIDRAFEIQPWYVPSLNLKARLLGNLGQHAEAISFLREASKQVECGEVQSHLASLLIDAKRLDEAEASIDLAEKYTPLPEEGFKTFLATQRSYLACHRGDYQAAIDLLETIPRKKWEPCPILENLKNIPGDAKKKLLEVPFVRQHHVTCAPATLSAIAQYWKKPIDHLDIVESICYDGTAAERERSWAIEQGFIVREFTMTWDATVALIDRGIPFTVTTIGVSYAHLQGVMGYDAYRGTLLIREPSVPQVTEMVARDFFKEYAPFGPRGFLLIPGDQMELLEGIELPDVFIYDDYYQIQKSLLDHQREHAVHYTKALVNKAPRHLLTYFAQISIAYYDNNMAEAVKRIKAILAMYPDCEVWKYRLFCCLKSLGHEKEAKELLQPFLGDPKSDPAFRMSCAIELRMSGKQDEAIRLLRRSIRKTRSLGRFYSALGDSYWAKRSWDKTLLAYQVASSLDDKHEQTSQSYFTAACLHGKRDETFTRLKKRFERYGKRSGMPVQTLFWACESMGQAQKGFHFLQQAIKLRPEDGELTLFAADACARWGHHKQAGLLLKRAEGTSKRSDWISTAANMARYEGKLDQTLAYLEEAISLDPLSEILHRKYADTLDKIKGRDAVMCYLDQLVERFPYHQDLLMLRLFWTDAENEEKGIEVAQEILKLHPTNCTASKILVLNLTGQGRWIEAENVAQKVIAIEPSLPLSHWLMGHVCESRGETSKAKEFLLKAIQLDVEYIPALHSWISICKDQEERRKAIDVIVDELKTQTVFGPGILEFATLARGDCTPEEIKKVLVDFYKQHLDLWQSWVALIQHLTEMSQLDVAAKLAEKASVQFPLLPEVWTARAEVSHFRNDHEREEESLQKAITVSPGDCNTLLSLCDFHERCGDWEKVLEVARRAIAIEPNNPRCLNVISDAMWHVGHKNEAVEKLKFSLKIDPSNDWAWRQLNLWAESLGVPNMVPDLARTIVKERPNKVESWLMLADMLRGRDTLRERIAAVDRAITLAPLSSDAYSQKAALLVELGKIDEAFAACRPSVFGKNRPIELEAKEAWIHAQRGDLDTATQLYTDITRRNPSYAWVWDQLCDIYEHQGNFSAMQEAAMRLVECCPTSPISHCRLASAFLATDQKDKAKESFYRVLEFAPNYTAATFELIHLLLVNNEIHEASQLMKKYRSYFDEDEFAYWNFQLVARNILQKQNPEPANKIKTLLNGPGQTSFEMSEKQEAHLLQSAYQVWTCPTMNDSSMRLISGALLEIYDHWQWLLHMKQVLSAKPSDNGAKSRSDALLAEYVYQLVKSGEIEQALDAMKNLPIAPAEAENAAAEFLRAVGELSVPKKARPYFTEQLQLFIEQHQEHLHRSGELWALVGYAYNCIGNHKKTVEWFSGWESRPDVEGWMLENLVHSLHATGRGAEAARISQYILDNPYYGMQDLHEAWLMFYETFQGQMESPADRFTRINQEVLLDTQQAITRMSMAVIMHRRGIERQDHALQEEAFIHALTAIDRFQIWIQSDEFSRSVCRKMLFQFLRHGSLKIRLKSFLKIIHYLRESNSTPS